MIAAVSDWPIDTPVLARLTLYAVLPLGSWVAAAMVERGVDSLLH